MSNDLVVQLGAKLDQFASDMNQAGDMADSAVSRIEMTPAMIEAGLAELLQFSRATDIYEERVASIYRAMHRARAVPSA